MQKLFFFRWNTEWLWSRAQSYQNSDVKTFISNQTSWDLICEWKHMADVWEVDKLWARPRLVPPYWCTVCWFVDKSEVNWSPGFHGKNKMMADTLWKRGSLCCWRFSKQFEFTLTSDGETRHTPVSGSSLFCSFFSTKVFFLLSSWCSVTHHASEVLNNWKSAWTPPTS